MIEIGDEADRSMSGVSLLEREGSLGTRIDAAGMPVGVLFDSLGELTARIRIGDTAERILGPGIKKQ